MVSPSARPKRRRLPLHTVEPCPNTALARRPWSFCRRRRLSVFRSRRPPNQSVVPPTEPFDRVVAGEAADHVRGWAVPFNVSVCPRIVPP